MQDRVPLYPGRVKLVPVAGLTNTYTMTRDDHPTQDGTPLNKATFLSDSTAALYGLGIDAVPDSVFSAIKNLIQAAQSAADTKSYIETGSYTGTGASPVELSFTKTPNLVFIQEGIGSGGSKYCSFLTYPATRATVRGDGSSAYGGMTVEWGNGSVSWQDSDTDQRKWLNESGFTYYYVAILS